MPGILPMKVIKVGSGAQPRIAQACDRCRSKKIRCDGIRPSCTQCVNVGFECKTSDKLSRRAFPRGYTESLEERVRSLETEVKDLKNVLDEKDEKLDMLSRIRVTNSSTSRRSKSDSTKTSTRSSVDNQAESNKSSEDEELFTIVQSPTLGGDGRSDTAYQGSSSLRSLMMTFRRRAQEKRKGAVNINVDEAIASKQATHVCDELCSKSPALMLSDRLVNTFFQEFAPVFPILHRPTFLEIYNDYVVSPGSIRSREALAQLYFVFAIASLSKHSGATLQDVAILECQGRAALDSFVSRNNLVTVQCLTLATLFFMMKSDWTSALRYKGQAVALAQRLGLHSSQKRFSLDALTVETRRRVFWSLFTLDCFSAGHLGLPMLSNGLDVHCELPFDADDEYITPEGFLPSMPGETTRLSSALALFKLSKLLCRMLSELYPAVASHQISSGRVASLQDDLDAWSRDLPPHLKLEFQQDKPFTGVISHRSPILCLASHYTQTLISRVVILASSSISSKSSASIISLATSSKRIFQVLELLNERGLALAFCLGETDLLRQSAVGLLLQHLEVGSDAKLISSLSLKLDSNTEFVNLIDTCLRDRPRKGHRHSNSESKIQKPSKSIEKPSSKSRKGSFQEPRAAKASRKSLTLLPTPHSLPTRASSNESMSSAYQTSPGTSLFTLSEPSLSPIQQYASYPGAIAMNMPLHNLEYMSLASPDGPNSDQQQQQHLPFSAPVSATFKEDNHDWVQMLSNLDRAQTGLYDNMYGPTPRGSNTAQATSSSQGPPPPSLGDYSSLASNSPPTLRSLPLQGHSAVSMSHLEDPASQRCDNGADIWGIVPSEYNKSEVDELVDTAVTGMQSEPSVLCADGVELSYGLFDSFL